MAKDKPKQFLDEDERILCVRWLLNWLEYRNVLLDDDELLDIVEKLRKTDRKYDKQGKH